MITRQWYLDPCFTDRECEDDLMRLLVVEDDKKTSAFIAKALKAEGFAVDVLRDGDDALAAIEVTPFDAVVLDIMLIGRDGLSVLKHMRAKGNQTPVLLLSARGELNERVEGLNVTLQPGLVQGNNTLSIGDWVITKTGRFLDVLGGVDSVLTIVSRATVDASAGSSATRLIAAPTVGQINYLDDGGVAKTEIITEGALFTGRKLGTTP